MRFPQPPAYCDKAYMERLPDVELLQLLVFAKYMKLMVFKGTIN